MAEPNPIRVFIVDDQPVVRQGLSAFLMAMEDMDICGQASSGRDLLPLLEKASADIILMDLKMPDVDGLEATRAIMEHDPEARVIVLTSFHTDQMVAAALQAGAMGYLLKNATAEEIAAAIRGAVAGRRTLASEATEALIRISQAPDPVGHDLTRREREVLLRMVEGMNNRQIAEALVISTATVKYHVGNILSKLGVSSRVEAVSLALKEHILEGDEG